MRKRMTFIIPLVLGLAILAPAMALAAIEGSVHDVLTYNNTLPKKSGSCSQCHLPHKAGADKLFVTLPAATTGWLASDQPISLLCYNCHLGTTTMTRSGGTAAEVNPFGSTNKHGYTIATLTGLGDVATFPSDVVVQSATKIKCTSCHDVHDNSRKPFLKDYGQAAQGTDLHLFCIKCHPNRSNTGSLGTANTGNHPTNIAIADGGTNSPMQTTVNAAFRVAMVAPSNINAGNWNLGGHMASGTTAQTGNYNCGTCHAVHGNETTDYSSATDGSTGIATETTGFNSLLVMSQAVTTTGTAEPVCIGCHNFTTQAGPGATTTFSHPIGTADGGNSWGFTGFDTANGYRWGTSGTEQVIVCESCHDIHFTVSDNVVEVSASNQYLQDAVCAACHGSGMSQAGHHPSGVAVTAGTDYQSGTAGQVSSATDWSAAPPTQTKTGTAYSFPGGIMTCDTCHGGAGKAHNNTTTFPALAGIVTESDMCVDCHSANPSVYTDVSHASTHSSGVTVNSTHYVGPITGTIGTKYKRTATFSSGVAPKYSADSTNGAIICESCHTVRFKTVTARSSSNSAVAGTVRATVGLLLESSGNNLSVYDTTTAVPPTGTGDLCTGCHGSAPGGTGTTHPSLATMTTGASTKVTIATPFSQASNNEINCESCHRPHDAANGSGALILERAGTDSTRTAFDGVNVGTTTLFTNEGGANFCSGCHTTY